MGANSFLKELTVEKGGKHKNVVRNIKLIDIRPLSANVEK